MRRDVGFLLRFIFGKGLDISGECCNFAAGLGTQPPVRLQSHYTSKV